MGHGWALRLGLILGGLLALRLLLLRLLKLLHGLGPLCRAVLHRCHGFSRGHTGLTVKQMVGAPRRCLRCPQSAAIVRQRNLVNPMQPVGACLHN